MHGGRDGEVDFNVFGLENQTFSPKIYCGLLSKKKRNRYFPFQNNKIQHIYQPHHFETTVQGCGRWRVNLGLLKKILFHRMQLAPIFNYIYPTTLPPLSHIIATLQW